MLVLLPKVQGVAGWQKDCAIEIDPGHRMFGWLFEPGPNPGQWVTVGKADEAELAMIRRAVVQHGLGTAHAQRATP